MRNSEQQPSLVPNIRAHKPCVIDAQRCMEPDRTQFTSLRAQVKNLTTTIGAHHLAHEKYEEIQEIINNLTPEGQQELEPLITNAQQAIVETDSLLPKPLQQHQPEEKA